MLFTRYQGRTLRYNMRPRAPKPVAPLVWAVLAAMASLLLAWHIFRWVAL